jgi:quercetin dioxygenase-like cupin family protein
MRVFDLATMPSHPYAERHKNIFFQQDEFKARIIDLKAGGEMPTCQMESYVLFYVISGSAMVRVNDETAELAAGQCLITEPATLSMTSENGVRMMGVQIAKG